MRRKLLPVVLVALATVACGGENGGSPTGPSTTNNRPQPFNQTIAGSVSVFGTTRHPLGVPRSGNMTLTLTWGNGAVDLDLFLANTCVNLYPKSACDIMAFSDAARGTSELVSLPVTQGQNLQIFVDNLSTASAQNYNLQLSIQ
jgi:hypothetical protein